MNEFDEWEIEYDDYIAEQEYSSVDFKFDYPEYTYNPANEY